MDLPQLIDLNEKRRLLRPLLSPDDPADAPTAYYALWHDPRRTQLTLHQDSQGHTDGFLAICVTGADLFRPVVTLRAPDAAAVGKLVRSSLGPHRPYQLLVSLPMASAVREQLELRGSVIHQVHRLDPPRFQPVINVLVQRVGAADGTPRFQIEAQGQVVAMSGTNWRSPSFAEVFVYVSPAGRGRGWGRSVVSACTQALLEERLRPLYLAEEGNEASLKIARELGYVDSGARELTAEAVVSAGA